MCTPPASGYRSGTAAGSRTAGRSSASAAQAYRLLDVARALAAIHGAVTAGPEISRTRDTDPGAAAALDYGLSQRALIAVSGRVDVVAELITRRLAALVHSGLQALDDPTVRAVVRRAVRDVRTAPSPAPVEPAADPAVTGRRAVVDDLAACSHQLGDLLLGVVPAYLSGTAAADVLAVLCDEIGESVGNGLAVRRYAISGDRRALHGTVL